MGVRYIIRERFYHKSYEILVLYRWILNHWILTLYHIDNDLIASVDGTPLFDDGSFV